ncbi:MAG TPA: hypothetical protein VGR51_06650 [Thermoplasmata archaeon]|nr:hypothetical protein [Thermoplasmata archaeon]
MRGDPNAPLDEYIGTTCGWHVYVQVNTPGPGTVTLTGTAVVYLDGFNGWSYAFFNMAGLGDCSSYPVTAVALAFAGTTALETVPLTNAITFPAAGTYFIYLNAWSVYQDTNEANYFKWGVMIATFYPS